MIARIMAALTARRIADTPAWVPMVALAAVVWGTQRLTAYATDVLTEMDALQGQVDGIERAYAVGRQRLDQLRAMERDLPRRTPGAEGPSTETVERVAEGLAKVAEE